MNHEELIDKYFAGKLSAEESNALLEEVNKDPRIEDEFNFQKELTTSIKEARKRELKANLASLPIPKTYNPTPIYWGVAAFVGILLSGLYLYDPFEKETSVANMPLEKVTTVETESTKNTATEDISGISENTKKSSTTKEIVTISEEDKLNNSTPTISKKEPVAITSDKKTESRSSIKKKKEIQYNNFQEPSVNSAIAEYDDVHKSSDIEAPVNNLTSTTKDNKVSEIVPKIEANKKSYKKYQYDGQNLTLVGDYKSEIPYVLYEIKLDSEKKLYLKFESQYYEIKNTGSKTTRLEILTDPVVINELENK